jgi:hypothetical protein
MIAFIAIALAACYGVLLAALERPHHRDDPRLEKYSVGFLTAGALTVAAGVAHQAFS